LNYPMGNTLQKLMNRDFSKYDITKPELKTRYKDDIFSSIKIERDIQYKEALNYAGKNEKLLLDVYSPEEDTEQKRPVILYVHGGGLSSGSKEEDILASRMAAKGYVVVSVNYRLTPDPDSQWNNAMRNAMEDVVSAVDWIKANDSKYGIDKSKIVLSGYSAGAEIITNVVYGDYVNGWDRSGIAGAIDIVGNRLFWGTVKTDAPVLIIHGTADNINPYSDVLKFIEQLKAAGNKYQLVPFEGVGHSFGSYENSQKLVNYTAEFLYNNVVLK